MTPPSDLVLYARPGCHLCEEAREAVQAVLEERAAVGLPIPRLVERDIESNEAWHRAYLERIPVVELGDRRLELYVSVAKLRRMLSDELDRTVV